jgi:hypothetical protein
VSAVRSIGKASAATSDVNALHRARGCLSASGVFRSMYLSGVIVVGFLALLNVVGFMHSQIIYLICRVSLLHSEISHPSTILAPMNSSDHSFEWTYVAYLVYSDT